MENILKQAKKVYFIGIGGIGISAIAHMLLLEGKTVCGSDLHANLVTDKLQEAGVRFDLGQSFDFIDRDADLIVYSVAITEFDKPLFEKLKQCSIPILSYPQTLDFISRGKYTIAISGTHGKTTTTAMTAKVLIDLGLDPTVIVGSLLKNSADQSTSTNFVLGKSKYLVVEADEYRKSFHNLHPSILVITNLDEDHLDFYKDLADIQESFLFLVRQLPKDGFLICDTKLPNLAPLIKEAKCQVINYQEMNIGKLLVPGEHNRADAKAAMAVAKALNLDQEKVSKALSEFTGTWRRFEYKGKTASGALVYDDYAHNPQKVKAAIQGARELYPDKRLVVVFQPHLFSRTKLLINEFATSFNQADEVILTPIFPAREVFDPAINSEMLAEKVKPNCTKVSVFPDFKSIEEYLRNILGPNDVLITMGAGEQYKIGEVLIS